MVVTGIVDTSSIVDYLRGFEVARIWLAGKTSEYLAITPIVWMETVQGSRNKAEQERAIDFMRLFYMEHFVTADSEWAMKQIAEYALSHGVQFPDTMIAAVAFRLKVPIYTTNLKHFTPLPDVDERKPY